VHKPFYASGFLYHVASQQILLQTNNNSNPLTPLNMFGGDSLAGENATTAFLRIAHEHIKLHIEAVHLFPVYDYFYNTRNKMHHIFYAKVKKLYTFPLSKSGTFSWFTFKSISKLALVGQLKQDITISERVIRADTLSDELQLLPQQP
jgi:ADP-ribose pyrophosphatase YjhB (NUDIX family)